MAGWSGRQASAKLRMVVLLGLGTIFFSTYILFSGPHFEPAAVPSPPLVDYESHPASLPPSSPPSSPSPNSTASKEPEQEERLPPMYPELKAAELTLPQHDEDLPFPEGKNARFIRFGNQMWGVGLNNQLFEIMLNNEIARRAERAYVFAPFIWDPYVGDGYVPVSPSTNHLISSSSVRAARVPLRAFFHSPTSGEPWPAGSTTPRSVSDAWYDRMCPQEKRLQLDPSKVSEKIGVDLDKDEGSVIVDKWAMYLRNLDVQCVNIQWETPRIIDFNLMGSNRLLSLWPSFSISPVLTSFKWSPLVLGAVSRNFEKLGISSLLEDRPVPGASIQPTIKVKSVIPGLITIHVRRKDYNNHCRWMAGWAQFGSWNLLSFLPDRFVAPWPEHSPLPDGTPTIDTDTDPRARYMIPRCWVEIEDIVRKIRDARREYMEDFVNTGGEGKAGLWKVYISTNEDRKWVDSLEEAIRKSGDGEWKEIASTPDLQLDWEEGGVDSAIDMEMASRGEVFIGNGFSTFTSTIVSLRLSRGLPAKNIRFW